jgi:hypothetical protein
MAPKHESEVGSISVETRLNHIEAKIDKIAELCSSHMQCSAAARASNTLRIRGLEIVVYGGTGLLLVALITYGMKHILGG